MENNNTAAQQEQTGEKMFTQEEVNEIVKNRLNRAKKQDGEGEINPLAAKEAELQAREMRLLAREKVADAGMPAELANVISCTDEKDLEAKLEILKKYVSTDKNKTEPATGFKIGAPGQEQKLKSDPIREAMGL